MASSPETGSLTVQEVRRMADLAGLELSDDEADRLTSELADILGHFRALRAAETAADAEDAEPAPGALPGPVRARLRSDEPGGDALAEGPGTQAPEWNGGFFTVPRLASHSDTGEEPS